MERREKVEEARRETERILAAQEAEVAARKVTFATLQAVLQLLSLDGYCSGKLRCRMVCLGEGGC
jgi:hypothetical protein